MVFSFALNSKAKLKGLLCQWVSDGLNRIDNGLFTFEKYPHLKDTKYPHLKDTKCPHMKDTKYSHLKNTKYPHINDAT